MPIKRRPAANIAEMFAPVKANPEDAAAAGVLGAAVGTTAGAAGVGVVGVEVETTVELEEFAATANGSHGLTAEAL
jgi:hypothetical protein